MYQHFFNRCSEIFLESEWALSPTTRQTTVQFTTVNTSLLWLSASSEGTVNTAQHPCLALLTLVDLLKNDDGCMGAFCCCWNIFNLHGWTLPQFTSNSHLHSIDFICNRTTSKIHQNTDHKLNLIGPRMKVCSTSDGHWTAAFKLSVSCVKKVKVC